MRLKLKIIKNKFSGKIYTGYSVLEVPKGLKLKVIEGSITNIGNIIERTDNDEHPFICIDPSYDKSDTNKWGNSLGHYNFQVI